LPSEPTLLVITLALATVPVPSMTCVPVTTTGR